MELAEHPSSEQEPPTPDLPKVRGSVELDASARQQRVGTVNYEEMLEPAERKASIGAFAYGGKSDVAAAGAEGPANSLMSALNVEQQQQFWSSVRMKPLTLHWERNGEPLRALEEGFIMQQTKVSRNLLVISTWLLLISMLSFAGMIQVRR